MERLYLDQEQIPAVVGLGASSARGSGFGLRPSILKTLEKDKLMESVEDKRPEKFGGEMGENKTECVREKYHSETCDFHVLMDHKS